MACQLRNSVVIIDLHLITTYASDTIIIYNFLLPLLDIVRSKPELAQSISEHQY